MCIKNWKNVLIGAVLFLIVAQVLHTAFAFASMGYYMDPAYFGVWSKIMMPADGPPPAEFYYYGTAFGFISALIYALIYEKFKSAVPGKTFMNKGLNYGLWIIFLAGTVPGYLGMYLLVNLPAGLIVQWAAENLIIAVLGGILIARFNK